MPVNHAFRLGKAMVALSSAVNQDAYAKLQEMAIERSQKDARGMLTPYGVKTCAGFLECALGQLKTVARDAVRQHAKRDPLATQMYSNPEGGLWCRIEEMRWRREHNSEQERKTVDQVLWSSIVRGVPSECSSNNTYGRMGLVVEVTYADTWRALYEVAPMEEAILWAN